MTEKKVLRGDVYYVDFGTNAGSAMNGLRPALVISNNKGNENGPTVIIAAITSHIKARYLPTHVVIDDDIGLSRKSMLAFEQIKTVDKSCLQDKIGRVSDELLAKIDQAIAISVGLSDRRSQMDQTSTASIT